MEKIFKGRIVANGNLKGQVLVSRGKINFTAVWNHYHLLKGAVMANDDSENTDVMNKEIAGKILCLPTAKESHVGGLFLHTAAKKGIAPAAILFSGPIDPETASGILFANLWTAQQIVAVDRLGDTFLKEVDNHSTIEIKYTGEIVSS